MALTGYTPRLDQQGQPVGFDFHRDDGPSRFLYGREADALKQWIDQTRPPDQRMASNGWNPGLAAAFAASSPDPSQQRPPPPPSMSDAGGMSMPPEPAPNASVAPPTPAPMPAARAEMAPPQPRPAPSGPQPIQPPSGDLPPMQAGNEGPAGGTDYRGALRDVATQRAYQLAMQGAGGGRATPAKMVNTERTVEGALSPEDEAANRKMIEAQRAANDANLAEIRSISEQRKAAAIQQEEAAADQALNAHSQLIDAQRRAAAVQQTWDSKYASLQKEQDAVARQTVDPRRLFHGDSGTLNAITSAIAVGLGAFGASLTGGPNYAHQIVQASIDRDIQAQEDAIRRRGDNANNAMSNFMRAHGMDADEARTAVKAIAQQYAGSLAQIQAARMGSLDAQQKAAEFAAKMQQDSNQSLAELQAKVMGKATEKYKLQGGGGGGTQELQRIAAAMNIDKTAAGLNAAGSKQAGEVTPNLSRAAVATDNALASLYKLREKLSKQGLTGRFLDSASKFGADSDYMAEVNHASQAIASAEANGLAPDMRRVEELESSKLGSNNTNQAMTHIDALIDQMQIKRDAIREISGKTAKIGTIAPDEGGDR